MHRIAGIKSTKKKGLGLSNTNCESITSESMTTRDTSASKHLSCEMANLTSTDPKHLSASDTSEDEHGGSSSAQSSEMPAELAGFLRAITGHKRDISSAETRAKLWRAWDSDGNGQLSLVEVDRCVMVELLRECPSDGEDLWRRYRPSYILAFKGAKGESLQDQETQKLRKTKWAMHLGTDEVVSQRELRVLLSHLRLHAILYEVFHITTGNREERDEMEGKRITRDEWQSIFPAIAVAGKNWAPYVAVQGAEEADYDIIVRGQDGMALSDFCEWVVSKEKAARTVAGIELTVIEDEQFSEQAETRAVNASGHKLAPELRDTRTQSLNAATDLQAGDPRAEGPYTSTDPELLDAEAELIRAEAELRRVEAEVATGDLRDSSQSTSIVVQAAPAEKNTWQDAERAFVRRVREKLGWPEEPLGSEHVHATLRRASTYLGLDVDGSKRSTMMELVGRHLRIAVPPKCTKIKTSSPKQRPLPRVASLLPSDTRENESGAQAATPAVDGGWDDSSWKTGDISAWDAANSSPKRKSNVSSKDVRINVEEFNARMEEYSAKKLQAMARRQQIEEQRAERNCSFRPMILNSSKRMASSKTRRSLTDVKPTAAKVAPTADAVVHEPIPQKAVRKFVERQNSDLIQRGKSRNDRQRTLEIAQMQECTFHPDLDVSKKLVSRAKLGSKARAQNTYRNSTGSSRARSVIKVPPSRRRKRQQPVAPRNTPEPVVKLIVHTARWVARHGPDFEEVVKAENSGKPGWEFLLPGAVGQNFYLQRLEYERWLIVSQTVADVSDSMLYADSKVAEIDAVERLVNRAEKVAAQVAATAVSQINDDMLKFQTQAEAVSSPKPRASTISIPAINPVSAAALQALQEAEAEYLGSRVPNQLQPPEKLQMLTARDSEDSVILTSDYSQSVPPNVSDEKTDTVFVCCPENVASGEWILVTLESGQIIDAQIPPGVNSGEEFQISLQSRGTTDGHESYQTQLSSGLNIAQRVPLADTSDESKTIADRLRQQWMHSARRRRILTQLSVVLLAWWDLVQDMNRSKAIDAQLATTAQLEKALQGKACEYAGRKAAEERTEMIVERLRELWITNFARRRALTIASQVMIAWSESVWQTRAMMQKLETERAASIQLQAALDDSAEQAALVASERAARQAAEVRADSEALSRAKAEA
eukprot:SAG31_NODE_2746_length_5147_cov_15.864303_1_plen_1165_part_10